MLTALPRLLSRACSVAAPGALVAPRAPMACHHALLHVSWPVHCTHCCGAGLLYTAEPILPSKSGHTGENILVEDILRVSSVLSQDEHREYSVKHQELVVELVGLVSTCSIPDHELLC